MKHKIFLIITLITILAVNMSAQVVKNTPKILTQEEIDEIEVVKFADEFVRILEKTKDLDKVPKSFFVSDFRKRVADALYFDLASDSLINQLDETARYESSKIYFNQAYLALMYIFGSPSSVEKLGNTDLFVPKNLFPKIALNVMKKSELLSKIYFNDSEYSEKFEISDLTTLKKYLTDTKQVIYAQRLYLKNRSTREKRNYGKNIKDLRNAAFWFSSDICTKDCKGFPDNTQTFEIRYYPLYLKLIKQNSKFKIFEINVGAVD